MSQAVPVTRSLLGVVGWVTAPTGPAPDDRAVGIGAKVLAQSAHLALLPKR